MSALAKRSFHSSVLNLNRNLIEDKSDKSTNKPILDNKDNAMLYFLLKLLKLFIVLTVLFFVFVF